MWSNRIQIAGLVAVFCLSSMVVGDATADEPLPTVRTFGYLPINTSPVPDWEAEGSIALTILPDAVARAPQFTIWFTDDAKLPNGGPFPYAGTKWRSHPVHHAKAGGGEDNGIYLWLESEDTPDAPPVGAHTFTGPDGLLVVEGVVHIQPCSETGAGCAPTADPNRSNVVNTGGERFVIGQALFSR